LGYLIVHCKTILKRILEKQTRKDAITVTNYPTIPETPGSMLAGIPVTMNVLLVAFLNPAQPGVD
jgi:hypothetical protein